MAKATEKTKETFFSHDMNARNSAELLQVKYDLGHEGKSVFWDVIEFMHANEFPTSFLPVLAKSLDTTPELLTKLMSYENLFYIEDGFYKNDRVLRNQAYVQQKAELAAEAGAKGQLLKAFNKEYKSIFGEYPTLSKAEVSTLYSYNERIENLKDKLPDVLYTMSLIPAFDNGSKPRSQWLLNKDANNLGKIVDGGIGGGLKSKKAKVTSEAKKQSIEEQKRLEDEKIEADKYQRLSDLKNISNKDEALDWIRQYIPQKFIKKSGDAQQLITEFKLKIEEINKAYEDIKNV